ncbi:sterol desaturase family protein [Pontibacter akesuensis]|uniref:Sterol desaturase/sphingolipid hydroxylase, fatty acid hydroxylase superfamily n=1 Tax=Pontibacter akesuensis TaxID=388950 RepID=A0A1I7I8C4_9BACT|nr:sterol desaturase family protein [Pontibacter akesuensis]GHA65715.1 sterol desaturase [Pontibacter akesuensis]SFU69094.1 Sterol desaturase/sphingolipid hydroxylase, fatty acid hydroxylase superfamily [Pontibacter akesuensis]
MKILFPKFDKIGMPLLGVAASVLFVLEAKRQLRRRTRPKTKRLIQNASVAVTALPALRLLLVPGMYAAARWANRHQFGLMPWLKLPTAVRYGLGFLLLDYGNYFWHMLMHRSGLLWRFHNVHHSDMDLDLSSAWRFHVGENFASVPYRGGVIALLGVPAPLVLFYEVIFEGCTAFHHSNLRLPYAVEKQLCKVMVTPRMHGIHHSIVRQETNSNYSVIFSWWDRLHQTLRLNVPQDEITIGVPAYRNPSEQKPAHLFRMPFEKPRAWVLPDGTVPEREERPSPTILLP